MAVENKWICDGPNCTEESVSPLDWIVTSTLSGGGQTTTQAHLDRFDDLVFHNEACLEAHLAT